MSGGGRSNPLRPALMVPLALQIGASLIGLLAGLFWLWASVLPVESVAPFSAGPSPRWWSLTGITAGVAVAVLTWFVWTVRGRAGLIVVGTVLLGVVAGGLAFAGWIVPDPSPIHPLGAAVPYAVAGFTAAVAALLLSTLAVVLSGGWGTGQVPPQPLDLWRRPVTAILVGCLTLLLVVATSVLAVDRSRSFLLGVNEYRRSGDVDRPPGSASDSELFGGDRWRVDVPGLTLAAPAVTAYGIAVASGQSVIMVDRATGSRRWDYTRSDIAGDASVAATDGGRQVLVWWDRGAVYRLDARTGERVGYWRQTAASSILLADPPLVVRTGADGRMSAVRISSDDAEDIWSFSLGTCRSARATPAGAVVLLALSACGSPPSRLVALEASTGDPQWVVDNGPNDVRAVAGGVALVLSAPDPSRSSRSLNAIGLDDGVTRWTRELPVMPGAQNACQNPMVYGGGQVVGTTCGWDVAAEGFGVTRYVSAISVFDIRTGSMVGQRAFDDGEVGSTVVTGDGRVLVIHGDWEDGCVLDVMLPREKGRTGSIQPGRVHECAYMFLVALGNQVLVFDAQRELMRSLR